MINQKLELLYGNRTNVRLFYAICPNFYCLSSVIFFRFGNENPKENKENDNEILVCNVLCDVSL